jgi:hypothetical protein
MALEHSKIREVLLSEVAAVRKELSALEALLEPALARGEVPALKPQLERVFLTIRRHELNELQLLEPVIRDLDAWGPVRAAAMDRERDELHALYAHYSKLDPVNEPKRWVDEVKQLIAKVRGELDEEEKDRLSPEILRDDLIRVDFGG